MTICKKKRKENTSVFLCLSLSELIAEQLLSEAFRQGEDGEREEPKRDRRRDIVFLFFQLFFSPFDLG